MRSTPSRARWPRLVARWGVRGLWAILFGSALATLLAAALPFSSYALDLLSHFAPHAFLVSLLALIPALAWRSPLPGVLSALLAATLLALCVARYDALAPGAPPSA